MNGLDPISRNNPINQEGHNIGWSRWGISPLSVSSTKPSIESGISFRKKKIWNQPWRRRETRRRETVLFPWNSPQIRIPEAMDISEVTVSKPVLGVGNRKIKKAAAMKRSKNLRKMKGIEKAISKSEHSEEKISKSKIKVQRIQSAKSLYDR
ncbi:hypothetical protein CKAN_01991100 [Cinnamomum micranthum f. kanehirae]|uniref:Uncharacterized protein n=1 Tax=Cinnamomum micranthum f. kanehirae TaxID=337451 RepID=A0A3S3N9E6_9MAGN|nr:hypothetical protein CKAN_01991100 [Cinnamomum micranthum f. kanehirae]